MAEEAAWKQALAELIGAFALVFVGAGSVAATASLGAEEALVTRALAHGIVIMAMVSAIGPISGGQISPAVTIGLLVGRKIRGGLAGAIIAAQLLGSVLAGFLLLAIYPEPAQAGGLGTPALGGAIAGDPAMGIVVEIVLTFFLVFVVYATAVDPRGTFKQIAGLAIGLTVAMGWFVGGNLTGAAMSPGRWIGPAVATMNFADWYVYWIGPLLGGVIAGALYAYALLPRNRSEE